MFSFLYSTNFHQAQCQGLTWAPGHSRNKIVNVSTLMSHATFQSNRQVRNMLTKKNNCKSHVLYDLCCNGEYP